MTDVATVARVAVVLAVWIGAQVAAHGVLDFVGVAADDRITIVSTLNGLAFGWYAWGRG